MIKVIGPRDKRVTTAINTTSRADNWQRGLSPFFLGPVYLYGLYTAKNVENAWQYSKVYKEHIDVNGEPNADYWTWAKLGWAEKRAVRYPMGKGAKPEYSLWDKQKLTYVEARKVIYAPIYSAAVAKTQAYKRLEQMYKDGEDIILWDFDGYDHVSLGMTYHDVINCDTKKMGHAFVLAMMLENRLDELIAI